MKSLERQPKVKKALKDIISHLREVKGRQTALLPMQDAPFQKKFQKTILGGFEDGVFARLIPSGGLGAALVCKILAELPAELGQHLASRGLKDIQHRCQ
jgi:hypothetical protein